MERRGYKGPEGNFWGDGCVYQLHCRDGFRVRPYRKHIKLRTLNMCAFLYVRELFLKASCMNFSPIFTDLSTAFGKSDSFLLFEMLLSPGFQDIASRSLLAIPHRQSEPTALA